MYTHAYHVPHAEQVQGCLPCKMVKHGQDDAVLSFAYLVHGSVIMSEVNRSGADAQKSSTLHKVCLLLVHLNSL